MAMQTGLRASNLKKILMSAGIGYTGWSFVRNGGFSDAASRQISATKKCLTQKTENMDAKPDGDNMSELSEDKTSNSVYNEVERAHFFAMFEQWVIDHNRMYRSEGEKERRFGIFCSNMKKIEAHNSSCDRCKWGLTPFTDLTHREFRSKYCGGLRVRSDRVN